MLSSCALIRFVFDVQCPFAFVASKRIEALAESCSAKVEYFPVLLGGLYANTQAPQGKDGSATDVMNTNKQILSQKDLVREAKRWNVNLKWNSKHPMKSVKAQRLLCAAPHKNTLAQALYDFYWIENGDINNDQELLRLAKKNGGMTEESVHAAWQDKQTLQNNTTWASDRGVFGVPSFFIMNNEGKVVGDRFYFGGDRMFLIGRALGSKNAKFNAPLRLVADTPPQSDTQQRRPVLEWFHDFSSPWSYLSSLQVQQIAKKHNAVLVCKPILLGALFKQIGTPNVPMLELSPAKREYFARDLEDWKQYLGNVELDFPPDFPIRTVNALRVSIIEPETIPVIYNAVWRQGSNVGDDSVLASVLNANGFNATELLKRAKEDKEIKQVLVNNTKEAQDRGACGVPTFAVNGGELIWGQDRLHVVEDELASEIVLESKL